MKLLYIPWINIAILQSVKTLHCFEKWNWLPGVTVRSEMPSLNLSYLQISIFLKRSIDMKYHFCHSFHIAFKQNIGMVQFGKEM